MEQMRNKKSHTLSHADFQSRLNDSHNEEIRNFLSHHTKAIISSMAHAVFMLLIIHFAHHLRLNVDGKLAVCNLFENSGFDFFFL